MDCSCELCRRRKGDLRKNEDLAPEEDTRTFLDRIFTLIGNKAIGVPETSLYKKLILEYKSKGKQLEIRTKEVVL